jgi:poly-gamma-glutamate system protein
MALRASAARNQVPLIDGRPFVVLVDRMVSELRSRLGPTVRPGLVINVGGALIGLGTCRESYEHPPGLERGPHRCTAGTPGLALRMAEGGVPLLQVLNLRRMAAESGLPFDPVPLPVPGHSTRIYGRETGRQ